MKAKDIVSMEMERLSIQNKINQVVSLCYNVALESGWWTDLKTGERKERNTGELICLMHSELSEAMEAHRKGLMDEKLTHRKGIEVELADCVIRIMDFCGANNLDLGGAIAEKLDYNARRADHKIENRVKDGGKKY